MPDPPKPDELVIDLTETAQELLTQALEKRSASLLSAAQIKAIIEVGLILKNLTTEIHFIREYGVHHK
jgi:hypothetical protein